MGGKGRDIRWRGEGNYRERNHRGSNVAIINQPFLRDNVFGVGLKPRIPLTPLAWRFANFLEFLYIIDDENIRGVIAPTTSFHPWMKLVSFLFFIIIIISFFPKKRKTIRTFPPLWLLSRRGKFIIIFEREREENILVVEKEKEGTFGSCGRRENPSALSYRCAFYFPREPCSRPDEDLPACTLVRG